VTAILVHIMLDRARVFTSSDLHDEKMISLGKLAAGLAHELNNPASAAARSAKLLIDGLIEADAASRALGAMRLSGPTLAAIERARDVCLAGATARALSPIERADREETIASWLDKHGVDRATAAPLAETPVTLELLDELAAALDTSALSTTLHWIAAGCTTRALASEVEKAATRVHDLVAAVKRFTYMDRHAAPEAVDVAQGLSDTVAVLSNKARTKSIGMTITVEPNLPRVRGFGGELNQVWANLIDNALDAAPASGRVTVTAGRGVGSVIVSVVDDGPGIPADIQERIFDPFFTTKPVGKGTGLGLDIARRLVRRSDGEIEVESRPGRTEFRVTLPVAPDGAGAHASDAGTT
jgi:signal transduction histidine kinase